jgi:hypothetical protein
VVQGPARVVEPEQERADALTVAVLVPAEPGDHAVRGACVLDLLHHALAGLVERGVVLGDHAIEARALEAVEPIESLRVLARRGGQVNRRLRARERTHQALATLDERTSSQIVVALGQQIEGHERRRELRRQLLHPRRRRVQAQLERREVESIVARDHDLAIEHHALGQRCEQRLA